MASPQTQPAPKPATAKRGAKPKPEPENKARNINRIVRTNLREELERDFAEFLNDGQAGELLLMKSILQDRSGTFGSFPKQRGEHEIPILSAIEITLTGNHCVPVPEELVSAVEKFIEAHDNDGGESEDTKPLKPAYPLQSGRRADLRAEIENFIANATDDDVFGLLEILYRYDGLLEYEEKYRPVEMLKSAALEMIERDKWLVKAPSNRYGTATALMKLLGGDTWIFSFLKTLAEADRDSLTPCAVSNEAKKYQKQFDADVAKAKELRRDYPKLVA